MTTDGIRRRRTTAQMRTRAGLGVVLITAALAAACGKDSPSSPTPTPTPTPSPTTPAVTSVAISGLDAVRTGFFSDYTASATFSDGTTQTVSTGVTWSSSNTAIGEVEQNGRLHGRSHGAMALSATYQGRTGTKNVGIVNNYAGSWSGSYTATACDSSGAFTSAQWCKGVVGVPAAMSLELTQTGNDRRQVSGTMSNLFIFNAPVSGTVTDDGRLVLGADAMGNSYGVTFRFQLGGWETTLASATQMTGRTAVNLTASGVTGNAYEEHRITSVTRSASAAVPGRER